ncbi:MAG: hypothetical protein RMJ59_02210 [Candidatus Nitrosocaldus sp.]|nr:hypothetical protein [Candidatus Nitrosocaldus sp.]MDW8275181.1 hypothetical protein [Candidatus Nitrosocaldus sp.]
MNERSDPCEHINTIMDEERGEIVCCNCGIVIQDRLERDPSLDLRMSIDDEEDRHDRLELTHEGYIHPLNKSITLGTVYMGGMHLNEMDQVYGYLHINRRNRRLIRLDQRSKYEARDISLYRLVKIYSERFNIPLYWLYDLLLICKREHRAYVREFVKRLKRERIINEQDKMLVDEVYQVNWAILHKNRHQCSNMGRSRRSMTR